MEHKLTTHGAQHTRLKKIFINILVHTHKYIYTVQNIQYTTSRKRHLATEGADD